MNEMDQQDDNTDAYLTEQINDLNFPNQKSI